jgi:UDP-N-acetylglucosamine 1-carboxyvinyltransferase
MMAAYLATVEGHSRITDPVYTTRFGYSGELNRLSAKTEVLDHSILIEGSKLTGAPVKAADIRAGAALVIAAAAAQGESRIDGVQYLNRGYERLIERFSSIGVNIRHDEMTLVNAA